MCISNTITIINDILTDIQNVTIDNAGDSFRSLRLSCAHGCRHPGSGSEVSTINHDSPVVSPHRASLLENSWSLAVYEFVRSVSIVWLIEHEPLIALRLCINLPRHSKS